MSLFSFHSFVHISQATLHHLGDTYQVIPGEGYRRDSLLKERDVQTYFIIQPTEENEVFDEIIHLIHLIIS